MSDIIVDVAVIGAGPAGIAAGVGAKEAGAEKVAIFERDWDLGGILQQCIHPGFGLHAFGEELTGPEYVHRWISKAREAGVEFWTNSMVFHMEDDGSFWIMNPSLGIKRVVSKSLVLAMGCRERPLGALGIPGTRPAGIYTAGTAQRLVNMEGYMPGNKVVILGSGDVGLIMARRMIWEGAEVLGVYEIMPWPGGLRRNIAQCLDDYCIPFYLEETVIEVHGKDRLEGVTVAKVDKNRNPIVGTEKFLGCDTLLLAVGLIPENELSRMADVEINPVTQGPIVNELLQTSKPNIFAAGNVVIVYDLVDWVSMEGERAGRNAALFAAGKFKPGERKIKVSGGDNVRLYSPQWLSGQSDATIYMRVAQPIEKRCKVVVEPGLYERRLRYARPGEMNEAHVKLQDLQALGDVDEIIVDIKEV
ncbi:Pyruvate/2-oxoglutarate dehydrogenase complex, dihydrolipoamide dehydrogenase (E3) component [Acetomicrobium thermoterrenum DSM 13490]|uniref:Pyruvate/2-oxoglutarate dehydrogenase complex, dihydrolipoamide dehydrogenase (E3) component n=1 Tax=Acetomicrobium thermoterrenum DSM 13490 TaxID=1120987 RepID=A0A1H3HBM5_9BACT|nr:FAD-dependent oxidoreductase [Acetomicrobium thermoterrenum]SDY12906.1 Pyruvate/2-oxoglutarate dehydrogenase complex, dihydrolipoamide dehydrogenase (E3) component [Acetomicrobium thermoterrenum DSM 13490]